MKRGPFVLANMIQISTHGEQDLHSIEVLLLHSRNEGRLTTEVQGVEVPTGLYEQLDYRRDPVQNGTMKWSPSILIRVVHIWG